MAGMVGAELFEVVIATLRGTSIDDTTNAAARCPAVAEEIGSRCRSSGVTTAAANLQRANRICFWRYKHAADIYYPNAPLNPL
jgi:hypothetical protein